MIEMNEHLIGSSDVYLFFPFQFKSLAPMKRLGSAHKTPWNPVLKTVPCGQKEIEDMQR